MDDPTPTLGQRLGTLGLPHARPSTRRSDHCRCGRPVFFRNSLCLVCRAPLGYEPRRAVVAALAPGPHAGSWRLDTDADAGELFRRCANFDSAAGCNWLVPEHEAGAHQGFCIACRLNRTIPDQRFADNQEAWRRIEEAKRRLVSALLGLGLPVASRLSEDRARGLAFDFLCSLPGEPAVVTGHAGGVITLDVAEADDAQREAIRTALREPYRTLLGHLRHEVGHYYWDRLVAASAWLPPFREVFGDERADYAAALRANYEHGSAPDWALRHLSAYASSHPWEDWAETWAHYLHMVDVMDTALSFGLDAANIEIEIEAFTGADLWRADAPGAAQFLGLVNAWVELVSMLNELSRSMGQSDLYPFVLPHAAVRKLHFIHCVVSDAAALKETPGRPRFP